MADRKVTDTVTSFIDVASTWYAKMQGERFSQEMYCNCVDMLMDSPIEQLFWIAAQALCAAEFVTINPEEVEGQTRRPRGIYIRQQAQVGKYRVDFLLEQVGQGPEDIYTPVIVELDGHAFHDKDKRQRSYEKARDRFLVKERYRVLHFTGSDVVSDPFKVAYEALEMLCLFAGSGRDGYNKNDPLDIGG